MKALAVCILFGFIVGVIQAVFDLAFWPSAVVFWLGVLCNGICQLVDE